MFDLEFILVLNDFLNALNKLIFFYFEHLLTVDIYEIYYVTN